MDYRLLTDTPAQTIYAAFLEAFADYFVQVKMPLEVFLANNKRRGVDYSASMGAFDKDRLVGFTLNGIGSWNGTVTAYDAGTGVVPSFRGKGISKELFRQLLPELKIKGVGNYLLEVIQENVKAYELYLKLGFKVSRELDCYRSQINGLQLGDGDFSTSICEVHFSQWLGVKSVFEASFDGHSNFLPSWQNSWDSVLRLANAFKVFAAYDKNKCIGYGIIAFKSGDIAQLWVEKSRCRQGVGRALLRTLCLERRQEETVSWLNVDSRATDAHAFLKSINFSKLTRQYEMEMAL